MCHSGVLTLICYNWLLAEALSVWRGRNQEPPFDSQKLPVPPSKKEKQGMLPPLFSCFSLMIFWKWATKVTLPSQRKPGGLLRCKFRGQSLCESRNLFSFLYAFQASLLAPLPPQCLIWSFWSGNECVGHGKNRNGCWDQTELWLPSWC